MKFPTWLLLAPILFIGCAKKTVLNEKPESAITAGFVSSNAAGDEPMIGYATVNGMTTGGAGGDTVTVSTLSGLISAAGLSSPKIILVSGTITGTGSVWVKSNKSILGLSGATLNGVGLRLFGTSTSDYVQNIIIRNLKIKNVIATDPATGGGDNDCIGLKWADHVWIDHCDLSADLLHSDWEYYDGLVDISKQSDYVTVSWTKFSNSFKGSGVGGISDAGQNKLHITYHHNLFENIGERAPSYSWGTGHVFNNYYLTSATSSGYSVGSRENAVLLVENNYFKNINNPIRTDLDALPGYISGLNTNVFINCGQPSVNTPDSTFVLPYSYSAALNAAADVPTVVLASAGTYSTAPPSASDTLQAENAAIAGGSVFENGFPGFNGTGYINPPSSGGSIQFNNVDGNGGGTKALQIRYSLASSPARNAQLVVNGGSPITITASSTGAWDSWTTLTVNVALNNNSSNTIRIQTNGSDWGLVDQIIVPLTTVSVPDTLQAENATIAGGSVFENGYSGFNGTGYINPPSSGGSIQFNNVDGNGGGTKSIAIRYSLLSGPSRNAQLIINGGTPVTITASSTGSWSTWTTLNQSITLNNNSTNTIKILTNGSDWGLVDQIIVP